MFVLLTVFTLYMSAMHARVTRYQYISHILSEHTRLETTQLSLYPHHIIGSCIPASLTGNHSIRQHRRHVMQCIHFKLQSCIYKVQASPANKIAMQSRICGQLYIINLIKPQHRLTLQVQGLYKQFLKFFMAVFITPWKRGCANSGVKIDTRDKNSTDDNFCGHRLPWNVFYQTDSLLLDVYATSVDNLPFIFNLYYYSHPFTKKIITQAVHYYDLGNLKELY